MKKHFIRFAIAAAVVAAPLGASALGTNEKGCLVGGAAGGLIGNAVDGNRTLLGAAIGCGAGVLVNKERVKRIDAKKEQEKQRKYAARKQREREARYVEQRQPYRP